MKTGTCYFPSYGAAMRYYRPYESPCTTLELRAAIDRKLNEGQIHIGRPPLKAGQTLSIEDNRYHITEAPRSRVPWEDAVYSELCAMLGCSRGDAQGVAEAGDVLERQWKAGASAVDAAHAIVEASK